MPGDVWVGGKVGVPKNMRALCAVIRPDHFKFASYGPVYLNTSALSTFINGFDAQVSVFSRT